MDVWIALATILTVLLAIWLSSRSAGQLDPAGRTVFISGCDSGIGRHSAVHFHELGCEVFAGCLDPATAKAGLPDSVHVVPLDVTSGESVRTAVNLVRTTLNKSGKDLWALVNNAGVCVCGFFEWQTWAQVERQVSVNVLGTMRLTKACIPLLREARGRLITVSSVNGRLSYPGLSVYSATKHALEGLVDGLRLELGSRHGIRAIVVAPGDYARATAIMGRHERDARDMWDGMDQGDRDRDGEFFRRFHRLTLQKYGLTSPGTLDGAAVLRDLQHAVLSRGPADRYVSAARPLRMLYGLLDVCPASVTGWLLGKMVGVMMRSDDGKQD